jgi:hypothetical protein
MGSFTMGAGGHLNALDVTGQYGAGDMQRATNATLYKDKGAIYGFTSGIAGVGRDMIVSPFSLTQAQTWQGIGNFVSHPWQSAGEAVNSVKQQWDTGNSQQRGEIAGMVAANLFLFGSAAKELLGRPSIGGLMEGRGLANTARAEASSEQIGRMLAEAKPPASADVFALQERFRAPLVDTPPPGGIAPKVFEEIGPRTPGADLGSMTRPLVDGAEMGRTPAMGRLGNELGATPGVGQFGATDVAGNGGALTHGRPGFERPGMSFAPEGNALGPGERTVFAGRETGFAGEPTNVPGERTLGATQPNRWTPPTEVEPNLMGKRFLSDDPLWSGTHDSMSTTVRDISRRIDQTTPAYTEFDQAWRDFNKHFNPNAESPAPLTPREQLDVVLQKAKAAGASETELAQLQIQGEQLIRIAENNAMQATGFATASDTMAGLRQSGAYDHDGYGRRFLNGEQPTAPPRLVEDPAWTESSRAVDRQLADMKTAVKPGAEGYEEFQGNVQRLERQLREMPEHPSEADLRAFRENSDSVLASARKAGVGDEQIAELRQSLIRNDVALENNVVAQERFAVAQQQPIVRLDGTTDGAAFNDRSGTVGERNMSPTRAELTADRPAAEPVRLSEDTTFQAKAGEAQSSLQAANDFANPQSPGIKKFNEDLGAVREEFRKLPEEPTVQDAARMQQKMDQLVQSAKQAGVPEQTIAQMQKAFDESQSALLRNALVRNEASAIEASDRAFAARTTGGATTDGALLRGNAEPPLIRGEGEPIVARGTGEPIITRLEGEPVVTRGEPVNVRTGGEPLTLRALNEDPAWTLSERNLRGALNETAESVRVKIEPTSEAAQQFNRDLRALDEQLNPRNLVKEPTAADVQRLQTNLENVVKSAREAGVPEPVVARLEDAAQNSASAMRSNVLVRDALEPPVVRPSVDVAPALRPSENVTTVRPISEDKVWQAQQQQLDRELERTARSADPQHVEFNRNATAVYDQLRTMPEEPTAADVGRLQRNVDKLVQSAREAGVAEEQVARLQRSLDRTTNALRDNVAARDIADFNATHGAPGEGPALRTPADTRVLAESRLTSGEGWQTDHVSGQSSIQQMRDFLNQRPVADGTPAAESVRRLSQRLDEVSQNFERFAANPGENAAALSRSVEKLETTLRDMPTDRLPPDIRGSVEHTFVELKQTVRAMTSEDAAMEAAFARQDAIMRMRLLAEDGQVPAKMVTRYEEAARNYASAQTPEEAMRAYNDLRKASGDVYKFIKDQVPAEAFTNPAVAARYADPVNELNNALDRVASSSGRAAAANIAEDAGRIYLKSDKFITLDQTAPYVKETKAFDDLHDEHLRRTMERGTADGGTGAGAEGERLTFRESNSTPVLKSDQPTVVRIDAEGRLVDPATGKPLEKLDGRVIDPATERPITSQRAQELGITTDGRLIDPATGRAFERTAEGRLIDPATNVAITDERAAQLGIDKKFVNSDGFAVAETTRTPEGKLIDPATDRPMTETRAQELGIDRRFVESDGFKTPERSTAASTVEARTATVNEPTVSTDRGGSTNAGGGSAAGGASETGGVNERLAVNERITVNERGGTVEPVLSERGGTTVPPERGGTTVPPERGGTPGGDLGTPPGERGTPPGERGTAPTERVVADRTAPGDPAASTLVDDLKAANARLNNLWESRQRMLQAETPEQLAARSKEFAAAAREYNAGMDDPAVRVDIRATQQAARLELQSQLLQRGIAQIDSFPETTLRSAARDVLNARSDIAYSRAVRALEEKAEAFRMQSVDPAQFNEHLNQFLTTSQQLREATAMARIGDGPLSPLRQFLYEHPNWATALNVVRTTYAGSIIIKQLSEIGNAGQDFVARTDRKNDSDNRAADNNTRGGGTGSASTGVNTAPATAVPGTAGDAGDRRAAAATTSQPVAAQTFSQQAAGNPQVARAGDTVTVTTSTNAAATNSPGLNAASVSAAGGHTTAGPVLPGSNNDMVVPGRGIASLSGAIVGGMTPNDYRLYNMRMHGGLMVDRPIYLVGVPSATTASDVSPIVPMAGRQMFRAGYSEQLERPTNKPFSWRAKQLSTTDVGRRDGVYLSNPYFAADARRFARGGGGGHNDDYGTGGSSSSSYSGVRNRYPFLAAAADAIKSKHMEPSKGPGSEDSEALNPDQSASVDPANPTVNVSATAALQAAANDPNAPPPPKKETDDPDLTLTTV